jgi:hypothetical protein
MAIRKPLEREHDAPRSTGRVDRRSVPCADGVAISASEAAIVADVIATVRQTPKLYTEINRPEVG